MQRSLYLIGPLLIVVALACGGGSGDSDGEDGVTPAAANGVTPTEDASPTAGASPTVSVSPTAEASATAEVTAETTPSDSPAQTVTAPTGLRHASPLVDVSAFLELFVDQTPTGEICNYNEDSGLMNCIDSGIGEIQLEPPVRGTGVECEAVVLDGVLLGIICTSEEPPAAAIYQLTD